MRPGTFKPSGGVGAARVRSLELGFERTQIPTEHVEYHEPEVDGTDISKAEFLLAVGRGVGEQENLPQFMELATALGATLAVSRPLVDAGWMPASRQVGQSGKAVRPKLYLALGISGAVQHLAGIRDAETVVAINNDPEAPIFNAADYGVVGDMFELVGALRQELE